MVNELNRDPAVSFFCFKWKKVQEGQHPLLPHVETLLPEALFLRSHSDVAGTPQRPAWPAFPAPILPSSGTVNKQLEVRLGFAAGGQEVRPRAPALSSFVSLT